MKTLTRVLYGTTLLILFYACKKETITPLDVPQLSVDRSALSLAMFKGYTDSFEVESSSDWELQLSPDTAAQWMEVSAMQGNPGKTVVKVKTIATNTVPKTATITIQPVGMDTPTVKVEISQMTYTLEWENYIGDFVTDAPMQILKTSDGGYVIAGMTLGSGYGDVPPTHGNYDGLVVKVNATGAIQWIKAIGGSGEDIFSSIALTSDGGYMIAGHTTSNQNGDVGVNHGSGDGWVLKLNASGDKVWSKLFGGIGYDKFKCMTPLPGGGYVMAGLTETNNSGDIGPSKGVMDVWVFKMDEAGNKIWSKNFGGSGYEEAFSVAAAADGSTIVANNTNSSNSGDVGTKYGSADAWILKLDVSGNIVWNKLFGGANGDVFNSVVPTADNGFILVGATDSYNSGDIGETSDHDAWVMKIDAAGTKQWSKTYGGLDRDEMYEVAVTPEGELLLSGYAYSDLGDLGGNKGDSDVWLLKLSSTGTILWSKTLGGDWLEGGDCIVYSGNGDFLVAANTFSYDNGDVDVNNGGGDIWLLKFK